MSSPDSQTISAVERAAEALAAFTRAPGTTLGVTELARELDLSKAVVHRILASFRTKGLVEMDPDSHRYRLGPAALALGLAYVEGVDGCQMARRALPSLVESTNESATVSVRSGWERVYIDSVTPDRDIKMVVPLGRPFPLHAGASSKAFLAFLPPQQQQRYLDEALLYKLTSETIDDAAALAAELERVRAQGCAMSYGERQEDAASVAAPVLDHRDAPVCVVSVCGPRDRFSAVIERATTRLLETTRSISEQLGHAERAEPG